MAPAVVPTPTLANVLLANNSAGASALNMNSQNILSAGTFSGTSASFSDNVSLTNIVPIIASTSTSNPLIIQSGVGQGITLQTNGAGTPTTPLQITSGSIGHNVNTTLPIYGIAPTSGQLGYTFPMPVVTLTNLLTNTSRILETYTLFPTGTYLFIGTYNTQCTAPGTVNSNSFGYSLNAGLLVSTGQFSVSTTKDKGSIAYVINTNIAYKHVSCVLTFSIPTTFYFICEWQGTGSFLVGGASTYTRIA